jgi:hypothetical protein
MVTRLIEAFQVGLLPFWLITGVAAVGSVCLMFMIKDNEFTM